MLFFWCHEGLSYPRPWLPLHPCLLGLFLPLDMADHYLPETPLLREAPKCSPWALVLEGGENIGYASLQEIVNLSIDRSKLALFFHIFWQEGFPWRAHHRPFSAAELSNRRSGMGLWCLLVLQEPLVFYPCRFAPGLQIISSDTVR